MSVWYTADEESIGIDVERKEIDFFVHADGAGGIYLSLTFAQIKELFAKILIIEASDKL